MTTTIHPLMTSPVSVAENIADTVTITETDDTSGDDNDADGSALSIPSPLATQTVSLKSTSATGVISLANGKSLDYESNILHPHRLRQQRPMVLAPIRPPSPSTSRISMNRMTTTIHPLMTSLSPLLNDTLTDTVTLAFTETDGDTLHPHHLHPMPNRHRDSLLFGHVTSPFSNTTVSLKSI